MDVGEAQWEVEGYGEPLLEVSKQYRSWAHRPIVGGSVGG